MRAGSSPSFQVRQQHRVELIGVAGVDQDDAVTGGERVDDGAGAADRVEIVEDLRRRDPRIVGVVGVGCAGRAVEAFRR